VAAMTDQYGMLSAWAWLLLTLLRLYVCTV